MEPAKSVALSYDDTLPAPFVAAKGAGHLAHKLVELAQQWGVPIASEGDLAETLFYLDVGSFIPEPLYRAVADVLVFVWETRPSSGDSVHSRK